MSRPRRSALPDGAFHVMAHAIDGAVLFRRDSDRRMYLGLLQIVIERHGWKLVTFVLMDNHVHLLVVSTTAELSAGLWWLHWRYAEYYKREYEPRFGHVFGGRPRTKPIGTDAYFLAVARYIARNPVPALSDRPEDHPWSAHRALLGLSAPLPILARAALLARFGPNDPVARYASFVTGSDPEDHRGVRDWVGPPAGRPELAALVEDRSATAFRIAHETWGYSLREIGAAAGLSHSSIRRAIGRAAGG